MNRKSIHEWAKELGYKIVGVATGTQISDRGITKEEFETVFPACTVEHIEDEYSLDEEAEANVLKYFRAAEGSVLTKSWKQAAEEMRVIATFIDLKHKENVEAKKEAGA